MTRVSVIVPLYNKRAYVRRALDSIAAQTFDDFELLVVDDGSTDGSEEIVEAYDDPRLRLIRQPNAGPGAARNRGLREARGELLAFLDADDEWLPGYLMTAVETLDRDAPGAACVTSGYIACPAGVSREPMWRARGIRDVVFKLTERTPIPQFVHTLAFMSPCSTVARASVVRQWGGFYDRRRCLYGEDAHLWLKVLLNERVALRLEPQVRFHLDASDLSQQRRGPRPVEPFLLARQEIEDACPAHLRPLLDRFLAARAFKTACMLGYWGAWREAWALRQQFRAQRAWGLPYYLPSLVCSTPLGAGLGKAHRSLCRSF